MLHTIFPNGEWHYLLGGLLVGAGVSVLFVLTGLVGGASTVFSSSWSYVIKRPFFQDWRLVYAAGMMIGALLWWLVLGPYTGVQTSVPWWQLLAGGVIAGFGARLANGCTSGHGICGLASLQMPSLLAVLIFLATAMMSARVVLALGGR